MFWTLHIFFLEHFKLLLFPYCFGRIISYSKPLTPWSWLSWSEFCALYYNIFGRGSPVFLVTWLMCCERLTVWVCSVYDIKLWISGTYDVTEYQYLNIIYTWYPVKKNLLQILSWKVTEQLLRITTTWFFRFLVQMWRIVYKLKCLYSDPQNNQ